MLVVDLLLGLAVEVRKALYNGELYTIPSLLFTDGTAVFLSAILKIILMLWVAQ